MAGALPDQILANVDSPWPDALLVASKRGKLALNALRLTPRCKVRRQRTPARDDRHVKSDRDVRRDSGAHVVGKLRASGCDAWTQVINSKRAPKVCNGLGGLAVPPTSPLNSQLAPKNPRLHQK